MKQITSKRAKVDADYEELARLEFLASLYIDKDGPIIPNFMIDSVVINGAKKSKEGQIAKSGCYCPAHASLIYDGPRSANELWDDDRFHFGRIVRIGTSRLYRMRAVFEEWSAIITVSIENTIVNPARINEWLSVAGEQVGIGDWRPQHGRFTVEQLNGK